jgi:polysaccharide pyruvyl transferase WcaK-like protein
MKKIYLYGYFGFGNAGDNWFLQSVVGFLDNLFPGSRFIVRSYASVCGIQVHNGTIVFQCAEPILSDTSLSRMRRLVCYLRVQWRDLKGCRYFVFSGGTVFHACNGNYANIILILLSVVMARMRGASVYAIGVGVGNLSAIFPRFVFSTIVRLSRLFMVRDHGSLENCPVSLRNVYVNESADLVFSFPVVPRSQQSFDRHIGISLAGGIMSEGFSLQFRKLLNLLQNDGWVVHFLLFQELGGGGMEIYLIKFSVICHREWKKYALPLILLSRACSLTD